MAPDFDILILGSGPSGVHVAAEAVRHGARVGLIDVGIEDQVYGSITPDAPFSELRQHDPRQHEYFLGADFESTWSGSQEPGFQLTPARMFVTRHTETLLPADSKNFRAVQSLALGGLGAGWGAGCASFEPDELSKIGLPAADMQRHYEGVAREIGISGARNDDVATHIAAIGALQPPLEIDSNASRLLETYNRKRKALLARGFKLGRPMTAILTEPLGERKPNLYHDMDFWSDAGESVYRPRYTLRELLKQENFHYLRPFLAEKFEEDQEGVVTVFASEPGTARPIHFRSRRFVLAAGAINSARLALRSLKRFGHRVPLLSNPYTYVPAINLPMFGQEAQDRRHSLVQLSGVYLPGPSPEDRVIAQFYSYRSLLLFRLALGIPLPPMLAMLMSRTLVTSLMIIGVNHADETSPDRYLALEPTADGRDRISIHAARSRQEQLKRLRHEFGLLTRLLRLKLLPLSVVHLPEGASIHYAGTLPFSDDERPLTCDRDGRLHGFRNVFVGDGSTWRFLPAKGLTFTLMANARRIAEGIAVGLKSRH